MAKFDVLRHLWALLFLLSLGVAVGGESTFVASGLNFGGALPYWLAFWLFAILGTIGIPFLFKK